MVVSTQMVGAITRVSRYISPRWLIPASKIPSVCVGRIAQTLSGTPTWLFQLPGLRAMCSSRCNSWNSH